MKKLVIIIRCLLFSLGAAGFSGFILPFLKRRILNIGNLAGLTVCTVILLYSLFLPRIHKFFRLFWEKTTGKIILSIFSIGIIASIVLTVIMSVCMVKAACTKPNENATVIVLGCKVYGDRPSIMLMERLDAAITYLNENTESVCIVSGGQGKDETMSEAECMYLYLTNHGISSDRIYKEDKSTSTRQNLTFSYEIIKKNGLNDNIAIVTNEFHEYRAGKIAEDLGLEYGAVPGATTLWLFPTYYTRELFAILYEWIV